MVLKLVNILPVYSHYHPMTCIMVISGEINLLGLGRLLSVTSLPYYDGVSRKNNCPKA